MKFMYNLPSIRNGICYVDFEASIFVKTVRQSTPIDLLIDILLLDKVNGGYLTLADFKNLESEEEISEVIKTLNPVVHVSMFRNEETLNKFESALGQNSDLLKSVIIKPFNIELFKIIKSEFDLDGAMADTKYTNIKTKKDVSEFIKVTDNIIYNIFETLNCKIDAVTTLLKDTYQNLGFILNRAYVCNNIQCPDEYTDFGDSLVGIFKSGYAYTYIFPNGFNYDI